jgi:hypothetical protein
MHIATLALSAIKTNAVKSLLYMQIMRASSALHKERMSAWKWNHILKIWSYFGTFTHRDSLQVTN